MTLEEKILQNYKSVMAFAKEIDVPYTTIKSMLNRGIGGTAIQTALLVCEKLNLDIEALSEGRLVDKYSSNPVTLSEYEIITKYRHLNESDKAMVDFIFSKAEYNTVPRDKETEEFIGDIAESSVKSITEDINKT